MAARRGMGEEVLGLPVSRGSQRQTGPHRGIANSRSQLREYFPYVPPITLSGAAARERASRVRGSRGVSWRGRHRTSLCEWRPALDVSCSSAGDGGWCVPAPSGPALRYWASDHLLLWEALRREGVEVDVIVAVRDDAAHDLYEETLSGWTPAGAALNEDELSFLQAIQASRRHPDPDEIAKWPGWEEAARIEAWLRPRLHRPPARIDRYAIHFADRLDDSYIGL